MCTVRKHYEYDPVWPSDYGTEHWPKEYDYPPRLSPEQLDDVVDRVLDSEKYLDTMECRCGPVDSATWSECNDLAYICPFDPNNVEDL